MNIGIADNDIIMMVLCMTVFATALVVNLIEVIVRSRKIIGKEKEPDKPQGGILSGAEILEQMEDGNIAISEFDEKRLNPNSVNVRLHPILLEYVIDEDHPYLDMKKNNPTRQINLNDYPDGFVMEPGKFYLGSTIEYTETKHGIVPMLEGRSSNARLSLAIHVTAGFGDVGFSGKWTLEMFTILPVKIYPGIDIGQVYYLTLSGEESLNYSESGKYNGQRLPVASMAYKDFE